MNKQIRKQLVALGLITSINASDAVVRAALLGFFKGRIPSSQSATLAALKAEGEEDDITEEDEDGDKVESQDEDKDEVSSEGDDDEPSDEDDDEPSDEDDEEKATSKVNRQIPKNVQNARDKEFGEARAAAKKQAKSLLADLRASAGSLNKLAHKTIVTESMITDAFERDLTAGQAMREWSKVVAKHEESINSGKVSVGSNNADKFSDHATEALLHRATNGASGRLSKDAQALAGMPLWAIASKCLEMNGEKPDIYGDRSYIAEQAMEIGNNNKRHVFFSENESRQYVQAAGVPFARPGDFPNILSNLMNKFLDTIELDTWSYPGYTALLPGGLRDFKPALMVNKGIVDELDVLKDAESFKDMNMQEEVLSYIFLQRFGNKWGWTPVMVANDDLAAFAEGMLGLDEAWQTTQNRLCWELLTTNPTLLDSAALFASRTQGNNDRTSGATPSDAEWAAMETLYADIKGIGTSRRVRGSLTTILTPTGTAKHDAIRTFAPLNVLGVEPKAAATTANVGIFRDQVEMLSESELRDNSAVIYYGFRNPTRLNTATIVRGYFAGFGEGGRRERWYDPETKVTYVSIEGRIGVAVKNWRYAVRNAGA